MNPAALNDISYEELVTTMDVLRQVEDYAGLPDDDQEILETARDILREVEESDVNRDQYFIHVERAISVKASSESEAIAKAHDKLTEEPIASEELVVDEVVEAIDDE